MTVDFEIASRKLLAAFTTPKDTATTALATLSCPMTGIVYSVDSIATDFDGSNFCFVCADGVTIEAYGEEMSDEYAKSVIVDRILDQTRDKRDAVARFDDFGPMTTDFEAIQKLRSAFTTPDEAATTELTTLTCPMTGIRYAVCSIIKDARGHHQCFITEDEKMVSGYGEEMSLQYAKTCIVLSILERAHIWRDAVARFDDFVST